jgi:L-ascorbate metabolism protein UlaG (beta-lactamase superfamily)
MGSVLDFSRGGQRLLRLYITGDTLMHDGIGAIAERFAGVDMCLIHLGGTRIAGVLLTMDGRQGAEALRVIAPREAIPVHYDDYTLFKSPLSDFQQAVQRAGLRTSIHYLERGQTYRLGAGVAGQSTASGSGPGPGPGPGPGAGRT